MSDDALVAAPVAGRGAALMPRPRVAGLLSAALDRRVTLVIAGAGYGKTTALADLAGLTAPRWARLRPADAQAESLADRLAAALGGQPSPGRSPIAAATGADDRRVLAEGRAALLCELAASLAGESLLIVDGLEYIGEDAAASHLLRVLVLQMPPHLHLVLSGRSMPDLGLGGAQGRGELLDISAPDLSFTAGEVAVLVAKRLGEQSATLAEECWSLTGGWPAALQLLLDRLQRLDRADHESELARLRHSRGHLWRAFARDLVAAERPMARRVLHVASLAPRVDTRLLHGVGVGATTDDLNNMRERGLLVEAGAVGYHRLSPVLDGAVVAEHGPDAAAMREQVARWLENNGRLGQALECYAEGPQDQARSFVSRSGLTLIRTGAAARVIDVLRQHSTGDDPSLDAVLAEALQAVGDWDAAVDLFMRLQHSAGSAGLPASVAWRYGVLLYLRGQSADAAAILAATHDAAKMTADDAMVSAWLSTTLWSQGLSREAADLAATALHQAVASGDASALAAAHVSMALAAASLGQRERNEQSYRLALAAARDADDLVQLARIHANLSSRALENGEYPEAISEAERALETGAGHRFFAAVALTNKAEAHLRLGQLDSAHAAAADASAIYEALGSLHASIPQVIFGELYRLRGDMVRARNSFERARGLATEAADAHTIASALLGLARVLADQDVESARSTAAEAVAMASSLERAAALCAAAEVELRGGDGARAAELARLAEMQARATTDRAALAEAFELQGVARAPGDEERLRSAIAVWDDIGNSVGSARARLALGLLIDDGAVVDDARRQLTALGVAPGVGVAGLLASNRVGREVSVVTLGRFAVLHAGDPVPLAAWQSRKARDLLKLLAARQGRPVTREAAAEAMWPGEDPARLSNRLSVALSTLRKVLDPARKHAADHYVLADTRTVALRSDHVYVDLIQFLTIADRAIDLMAKGDGDAATAPLQRARQLYAGDFLEEDLYEDWAVEAREEARSRLLMILRLLARLATDRGDDEPAGQYLGQLLEREPYDEDAWLALIAGQLRLRRHGEARRRYAAYARRMAELDVVPVPLADAERWRP